MHERTEKNPFGAGRPFKRGGKKTVYVTMSVSGLPTEIEKLKNKAKESHKTISRFVLESLDCAE